MLKVYKRIENDIFKAHKLIEYLVNEVWCKADNQRYKTKLNEELKVLVAKYDWLDKHIKDIYKISKDLSPEQKSNFKTAFIVNNKIEALCNGEVEAIPLTSLDKNLVDALTPFFEELYTKFLGWALVYNKYGKKKAYYDKLLLENDFVFCPCCGFGDIKTYYSKGHSPFDHYLPLKHYPFSAINFDNLFPMCHICNSDNKGEDDIIKSGQRVFYPFFSPHPEIKVNVKLEKKSLSKLITKIESKGEKLTDKDIEVSLTPNTEKVISWDKIFSIKDRYFGKIADHRISWIDDVRSMYRKDHIDSYAKAFDEVIQDDSNKYLGFLKAPYLENLKAYNHLVQAMSEVSGDHLITK